MKYIDIHTHNKSRVGEVISITNISLLNKSLSPSYFSVGLLPSDAGKLDTDTVEKLLQSEAIKSNCYAIGETGLDKRYKESLEEQIKMFNIHLEVAIKLNKPLIVHNVRSTQEILFFLNKKKLNFIFHGFTGNLRTALQIINSGGMLSFGKNIFYHQDTIECLKEVPYQSVFFETDNDNIQIEDIYNQAEKITGKCKEDLTYQIEVNFRRVFCSNMDKIGE